MGVMDNMLHAESARVVLLGSGNHSEDRSGEYIMENGHCALQDAQQKFKRQRVSAIRDFPPGCGLLASRINQLPNEDAFVGTVCPETDNLVPSSNNVERAESVITEPEGTSVQQTENLKPLECKSSNVSNNMNGVDIGVVKEEMVLNSGFKTFSPPDWPNVIPDGDGQERKLTRTYPPRRKISAVRDFPMYCRRSAPSLGKEDVTEVLASLKSLDPEKSVSVDNSLRETVEIGMKHSEEDTYVRDAYRNSLNGDVSRITCDNVQAEFEGHPTMGMENHDESCHSSKVTKEDTKENRIQSPHGIKEYRFDSKTGSLIKSSNKDARVEENPVRDIVVYVEEKQLDRTCSDLINNQYNGSEYVQHESNLVIVQGLMASSKCPWRQGKGAYKSNSASVTGERNKKKHDLLTCTKSALKTLNDSESSRGSFSKKNSSATGNVCQGLGPLVLRDEEDSLGHDGEHKKFHLGQRSRSLAFDVSLFPSRPSRSMGKVPDNDVTGTRNKVRETLRLFQAVCRKLLQEEEAKADGQNTHKRIDYQAARILKEKGKDVNGGKQIIGPVPGVEVGDEFHYRVELNIIGLHRQIQGGIDYVKHKGQVLATSIVASGGYDDDLDNSDVLIYTGQGGNVMNGGKEPEDQRLERGNLALVNSVHAKNAVRVIRGETKSSDSGRTYIYDGLYVVERYWQDMGPHGKLVFKFMLVRMPGQPELSWKVVKKCKKFKVREGLCESDISQGKELIPICAVNTIDDEKPPPFTYITSMIYPDWCHPNTLKGCDCTNMCSNSSKCSCAAKNGGEIPYNHNGAIVEVKTLVYECGPACRCSPSCYNRVSQQGIKFQLEVFKTESRGWGVRSLNSIPSGSFICEYIGEVLEDREAEKRTGNDEYLFDVGNNYNDGSLWQGLSNLMPDTQSSSCGVVEDVGFTIDAAQYGNVGRFINHSCSPNLYAQNVLYDHEDKRMPHIMLFAAENIPPLQELTYHYNYVIDQVHDSEGNIKKKSCYCGSSECTGRLY